jgi:hypothetical protein
MGARFVRVRRTSAIGLVLARFENPKLELLLARTCCDSVFSTIFEESVGRIIALDKGFPTSFLNIGIGFTLIA